VDARPERRRDLERGVGQKIVFGWFSPGQTQS